MAVSTADLRIADRCIADYSNEQRGPLLYHNRDDHDSTVTRRNNHDHTCKEKTLLKYFGGLTVNYTDERVSCQ